MNLIMRQERDSALIADAPTHTPNQLAEKHGVKRTTILLVLKKAGVRPMRGYREGKNPNFRWSKRIIRDKNAVELKCSKCEEVKPVSFFPKGFVCRKCLNIRMNIARKRRPDLARKRAERWLENNWDKMLESRRKRYREISYKLIARSKEYRSKHKDKLSKESGDRIKRYRKINPQFRLRLGLRQRMWRLIRQFGKNKSAKTEILMGIKYDGFIKHIESLWLNGMTWGNYGLRGWHIDHIKPCSSFDLSIIDEQKKCFHYTNLRPLWAADNLSKGDKIIDYAFHESSPLAVQPNNIGKS